MSKWRPSDLNCIYAIPSINGLHQPLQRIFKRILPLRKSDGGEDSLVTLGNVWGSGGKNKETLELLIEASKLKNVSILKGKRELNFLNQSNDFLIDGGYQIFYSYLNKTSISLEDMFAMSFSRLSSFIPKDHIKFIESMPESVDIDEYRFSNKRFKSDVFNIYSGDKLFKPTAYSNAMNINAGKYNQLLVMDVQSLSAVIATNRQLRLEAIELETVLKS